jgi:hypothetical protein
VPYYIQKSGKKSWQLVYRFSKTKARNVPKYSPEAAELGFRSEMTLEEAKAHATKLQAQESLKRENAARERTRRRARIESAFLAPNDVAEFERDWLPEHKIRPAHWYTMQKIIAGVGTHPEDWFEQKSKLYSQFLLMRLSANYAKKLLRYLNFWGYFVCKKQRRAYLKVPGLDGVWKNRLEDKRRPGGASKPLSPALLDAHKDKMTPEQYNWLFVSVWFGLRPREVDNLRTPDESLWYLARDPDHTWVLSVFQEKLFERGVASDDCWKRLPCVFPEQLRAVEMIQSGALSKPIGSKGRFMRDVFGVGFSHYAGRNNFSGLLRDAGFDLETRKHWLGHLSIKTTEAYDRKTQKARAFYRPPIKKAG